MSDDKQPEGKEYGLRPADRNMLIYVRNHLDAIFSGLISTVAIDRFGYKVTPNTQFRISDDFTKVTITEIERKDEGQAGGEGGQPAPKPPTPPAGDDSPVRAVKEAPETTQSPANTPTA